MRRTRCAATKGAGRFGLALGLIFALAACNTPGPRNPTRSDLPAPAPAERVTINAGTAQGTLEQLRTTLSEDGFRIIRDGAAGFVARKTGNYTVISERLAVCPRVFVTMEDDDRFRRRRADDGPRRLTLSARVEGDTLVLDTQASQQKTDSLRNLPFRVDCADTGQLEQGLIEELGLGSAGA